MTRGAVFMLMFSIISHSVEAQLGKQSFTLPEDSEQIDLWSGTMPDKAGFRNPEIISDKGSVTHISVSESKVLNVN